MIQNIIIAIIMIAVVGLLIRHFFKGSSICSCSIKKSDDRENISCGCCSGCNNK